MADESNVAQGSQTLHQGLADLRQTWEHLARELAAGVPELPGVIEQELAGLTLSDLNEENLIRVSEAVVARVADAGFPDEATALFRRMGRAMYELLLLLATTEEIREMESAAATAAVRKAQPTAGAQPVVASIPSPDLPPPPAVVPSKSPEPAGPPAGQDPALPEPALAEAELEAPPSPPDLPPLSLPEVEELEPPESAALRLETVSPFEPRDPARPASGRNGTAPHSESKTPAVSEPEEEVPAAASQHSAPEPQQPAPESQPVAPAAAVAPEPQPAVPAAPVAKVAPPTAPKPARAAISAQPAPPTPNPTAGQSAQPEPPEPQGLEPKSEPPPAAQPPPPAPQAPQPALATAPDRPLESAPASPAAPASPQPNRFPLPRDLTEAEAPLWGFDPADREREVVRELVVEPEVVVEPQPVPAAVATAPASPATSPAPTRRLEPKPQSGWTVRLSPRSSTERERKLSAREAQLPQLVEEIVATAKTQQEGLSSKGNARRALAAAREQLPLAAGGDPASRIQSLLEAGELEEAATGAIQLATVMGGEEAAGVACTVGEAVKQAKHVELAVLCFTTAVLCCPPCDRACWQLCTLSVERKDVVLAPVWLEFVARLLRARGADTDAISVYRQLLKLTPRRTDIRELLRISSLTGVLPD